MESFQLSGAAVSETATSPVIVTSFGTLIGSGDTGKFVSLLFETNPLEHRCDTRIVMTARSLEVVYDAVSPFGFLLLGSRVWKFLVENFLKFPEICCSLSGNFQKFVNYLCQSPVSITK